MSAHFGVRPTKILNMKLEDIRNWRKEFAKNPIKTLIYAVVLIIAFFLVVYFSSYISEIAKEHVTSLPPKISDKKVSNDDKKTEETSQPQDYKTGTDKVASVNLFELFKTDFSQYLSVNCNIGINVFPNNNTSMTPQKYRIRFRLHSDFESLTKFLSAYLPASTYPNTFAICQIIADQPQEIIKIVSEGVKIAGSRYDDRFTELKDLRFSRRVYIYSEKYLSADKIDELRNYYKKKKLDLRFRGTNYLIKRTLNKGSS